MYQVVEALILVVAMDTEHCAPSSLETQLNVEEQSANGRVITVFQTLLLFVNEIFSATCNTCSQLIQEQKCQLLEETAAVPS